MQTHLQRCHPLVAVGSPRKSTKQARGRLRCRAGSRNVEAARDALLSAIQGSKKGLVSSGAVLAAAEALEALNAETYPTASLLLEGTWSLLFTASAGASSPYPASRIDDGFRAGLQSASDAAYKFLYKAAPIIAGGATAGGSFAAGTVKADGSRQTIDLARGRVANEASFRLGGINAKIVVGGLATPVSNTRLDVVFDEFQLALGPLQTRLPLNVLSPRGAIETTFLDSSLRIGRGDKGSIFVCRRLGAPARAA